ncbi:MAG: hypothetical protein DMG53_16990 [Acidobacteria bacterium]|nr:MAG: hypothetical protein DMG53_16990 [Acidobacteriota bacterium]
MILEFAQFDALCSQLVLCFRFSYLSLLFFILQRGEFCLKPGKPILDLFPFRRRVLAVAYEIFVLLNIRC